MAQKKTNWILWVGLAAAAWYLWKMKKGTTPGIKLPGGGSTPSGSAARSAGQEASEIVKNVINETTFLPDVTTDRERYANDQNQCK